MKIHQINPKINRHWMNEFNYCFMIEKNNHITYFAFNAGSFITNDNVNYFTNNDRTLIRKE